MAKRIKVEPGLVFKFAVEPHGKVFYGQVLYSGQYDIYVVVFPNQFDLDDEVGDIAGLEPFLLAKTFTAKFKNGDWMPCFKSNPFLSENSFPKFKLEMSEGTYLVDFHGKKVFKKLNGKEKDGYYYESYASPATIESMMRTLSGTIEWDSRMTIFCSEIT